MNAKSHPISKTSIDLRRSINRLLNYKEQFPFNDDVKSGLADEIIQGLRNARNVIPRDYRDPDLLENQRDEG